jgi:hypothetical protein
MDTKKVTRRAAIGAAVGTIAVSPLIIRALLGKYEVDVSPLIIRALLGKDEVDLPEGTRPMTLGGRIVTQYDGVEIEIEVPQMVIETPEDEKKFKELVMEEIKKTPQFAAQNRKKLRDAKAQGRQQVQDRFAELEKEVRQRIANATDLSESEKVALQKKALEGLQTSKDAALKQLDNLALPAGSE